MNPLQYNPAAQAKAILASAIAALTRLEAVVDNGVTGQEWVGVALSGLVAYAAVFGVRNREVGQ